ncbi:putative DnaJ domain, Chaperone J-domain superfamily [Dioscorea sansibarensis]
MASSSSLLVNTAPPSAIKPGNKLHSLTKRRPCPPRHTISSSIRCASKPSSPPSLASTAGYDLYDLLGIDPTADQPQIKRAYRSLQKRCHPDIAGPAGHEMAIVINEIYSLLSDPISRSAYDQEQAKLLEFRGFTGRPTYSSWFGSESEERAVFVDEVKCVGCLKCALFARKTFAIEAVYGRARVIAQWADPEEKILEAIQTCPVDCISMVERSDLAVLEFLMSKQPRGPVRMAAGNSVGACVSNIFVDMKKFQKRFNEMNEKASKECQFAENQRESRDSAVQGIRSILNFWYWRSPSTTATPAKNDVSLSLTISSMKTSQPNTEKLREFAAKHKAGETPTMNFRHEEEYWTPTLVLPPSSTSSKTLNLSPNTMQEKEQESVAAIPERQISPVNLIVPTIMAALAEVRVGLEQGEIAKNAGLKEHIGGTLALQLVNSFELQILLAGITWFIVGMAIMGLIEVIGKKGEFRR